jgi:hypothetical protein
VASAPPSTARGCAGLIDPSDNLSSHVTGIRRAPWHAWRRLDPVCAFEQRPMAWSVTMGSCCETDGSALCGSEYDQGSGPFAMLHSPPCRGSLRASVAVPVLPRKSERR